MKIGEIMAADREITLNEGKKTGKKPMDIIWTFLQEHL